EDALVVGADRVELLKELVDERTAGAARVLAAREADRVELVEEEHARRRAPRLDEDVVQVALALPDERVEDLLDPHVGERQPALARRRAREHRLAAAGRAVEQDAAAGAAPVPLIQVRPLVGEDDRAVDRLLDV